MEDQNQAQQPEQAPPPISEECAICFENLEPEEPVERCTQCKKIYHRSCITYWLTSRRNQNENPNCPLCRGDMDEILNRLVPPLLQCNTCRQMIESNIAWLLCDICERIFHGSELHEHSCQSNNQNQVICPLCYIGEIPNPNYLLIQQAEQDFYIDNFNSDSESEPED